MSLRLFTVREIFLRHLWLCPEFLLWREYDKVRKKNKSIFAPVVTIIFSILVIISACVWMKIYRYLEAYEKNVPINTANKVANLYKEQRFEEILLQQGVQFDKFNTPEEYKKFILNKYGDDFSSVRASKIAKSGEDMVYAVFKDDKKLCEFTLTEEGAEDEFGFKSWSTHIKEQDYEKKYSVSVTVPKGAKVFVGDILLGDTERTDSNYKINGYKELYDESLMPQFEAYEVKNLLNEPTVKVLSQNDEEMGLTRKGNAYYALPKVTPEIETLAKSLSEKVGVQYALYGVSDIKFAELSPYIFPDCEYYKTVRSFYNEWYREHKFSYDQVEHNDIILYDDTHFSVRISFVYHIDIGWKVVDYPVSYNMFFINSGEKWLLCGMEL